MTKINNKIRVGNRSIGVDAPVFIIAEIGCNFEKSLSMAKEMIQAAAYCGVDAVKFQTFVAEKITTKTAPKFWEVAGCPGETQYEEFKQMRSLNFNEYKELKKVADRVGVVFFSSPEDEDSADMLEKLGVDLFKISSMNITHYPLLKHIAKKKKPIILSTGASNISEIKEAVKIINAEGNSKIILLHCITNYPTKVEDVNLRMMMHIQKEFPGFSVGYSDHTKMKESLSVLVAATAMGAKVIEKHFTFNRSRPGYDHELSADYKDMKKIVNNIRMTESALGNHKKTPIISERKILKLARRSIVAARDIPEGVVICREMLEVKRPATGIESKFIDAVVGRMTNRKIKEDEAISWKMLDREVKNEL